MKPWREVIVPHHDVASGKYQQAEFAADLAQVLAGNAEPEYQDANEFFNRTYLTEGMKLLLASCLRRACNINGEPVTQLKTAFGGGKTHTMLALYHVFNDRTVQKHRTVKSVLDYVEITKVPPTKIAVLVGTALDPAKPKHFKNLKFNTLWGYMAFQLGGEEGFNLIKNSDRQSTAPGSDTLVELFDTYGPCVILIDELVAYARNVYKKDSLPSGSFDSIMTFVQNLTEAVRRSKNSMVVAAIPESDIEIGGEGGQAALVRIENTFGRLEAIWKPVRPKESFEIVRRRLFEPVKDEKDRNEVCEEFSRMYISESQDFPTEAKEATYLERLKESYPIHPEVFDRLYTDWATLEKFQRTRGVLRLMAATIYELWIEGDKSLMIMPGSIPLNKAKVRDEITKYLPDGWSSVIDADIDSEDAGPKRLDSENKRFGAFGAARKVARTIFLGSAPSSHEQRNRGIEEVRIMLGCIQPSENIAVFRDALQTLPHKATYLFSTGQRYWYDTHPTLRKTVDDRAACLDEEEVLAEINRRLQSFREKADFAGIHIAAESEDVPDEGEARLAVLGTKDAFKKNSPLCQAMLKSKEILDNRGNIPRRYRNMLLFLAPDEEMITTLDEEVRRYLAWQSVVDDQEALNLDAHQRRQALASVEKTNTTINIRLNEAYVWLLVPVQEGTRAMTLEPIKVTRGEGSFIKKAAKQAENDEYLITKWSPALLKNELDKWLWKDQNHIELKKLWEYMASYPYLPRLRDANVLIECIRDGLRSRDFFGYASDIDESGKYLGLEIGAPGASVVLGSTSLLVKKEVALRQITEEEKVTKRSKWQETGNEEVTGKQQEQESSQPEASYKRFVGTATLEPMRLSRDVALITEEVISHLTALPSAELDITLEIKAQVPDGIPEKKARIILENCKTLKFQISDFEKE